MAKKMSKKKGAISVWVLALILMFLSFFALSLNMTTSWEMYHRANEAAEEAARVRSQAVDTYLKEATGIVEIFHTGGLGYNDNVNHFSHLGIAGHTDPKLPSQYASTYVEANKAAKHAAIDMLTSGLGSTQQGNDILSTIDEGNVCILIFPLPDKVSEERTLSCQTSLGTVTAENVRISSVEDNTKTVYTDSNGNDQEVKVVNAVFVGVAFEHSHFLESFMVKMGSTAKTTKSVWAIAYPQIDDCFGAHC
ncbi:hypothetical protein IMZ31_20725 (plasmid) [Pontibacillus sp. ALD_SL1]|uniref:hypothetical protein n=1 Tax=Pontibacillus sp. ALD_SL1 TaxID=2777185 RepID=UPI001A97230E|nr:hypothetical protein [Pontibacillus sp. ALD_SL1]QST02974.1 hypothetical protein IMZ31_20725 [Pontibacillus sp. ALD_SL1]